MPASERKAERASGEEQEKKQLKAHRPDTLEEKAGGILDGNIGNPDAARSA